MALPRAFSLPSPFQGVFAQFLTANGVASLVGIGMQAATVPLMLHFLKIEVFALWALAAAVAGIYSQLFNAFFYAGMNRYDAAWRAGHQSEARRTLFAMNAAMLGLGLLALISIAAGLVQTRAGAGAFLIISLSLLNTTLGYGYIVIDAHFRSLDRFVWGTNLLSGLRVMEWGVTIGVAAWLQSLLPILLAVTGFKFGVLLVQLMLTRRLLRNPIQGFREALSGALWLPLLAAAYRILSAQALLGSLLNTPQIAIGARGFAQASAGFNVHRTYMRLGGVLTNVLTAASWPILSQRHASRDHRGAERHMLLMTALSVIASAASAVFFAVCAPLLFNLVFRGKVALNEGVVIVMGVAMVANGVTNCALMYVLATSSNIASLQRLLWPLAFAPELLFLIAGSADLLLYSIAYTALEMAAAALCAWAVFAHIRGLRSSVEVEARTGRP